LQPLVFRGAKVRNKKKKMNMRTLELNFPNTVEQSDEELRLLIAAKLYENGTLTSGQAAELAGLSKREFIEVIGNYNVSVFSTLVEDLEADIENA
jgi:predicted HTH domain antitoxin